MQFPYRLATACAVLALALTVSVTVQAHISLERAEAPAGASYKAVFRVPHGCDGAATVKLRVQIPDGVIGVKPMPKPGWQVETSVRPYAKPTSHHGKPLTEGVREVTWTGSLADAHYDEFVLATFLSGDIQAQTRLAFPIIQECERGVASWTEVAAPGQDAHALKKPAPALMVLAQTQQTATPDTVKAGSLTIEAPWSRATPSGAKVAGGYLKITNTGAETDRLTGGSLPRAGRVEIHEMSVTDGVMRMRPLSSGLEIKAGETVELKPGGLHLMFMDLTAGLKNGESVKGTLVFEKAGTVDVTFRVAPAGSQGAGSGGAHRH